MCIKKSTNAQKGKMPKKPKAKKEKEKKSYLIIGIDDFAAEKKRNKFLVPEMLDR